MSKLASIVLLIFSLSLSGCATPPLTYTGKDAGYLIASIGEQVGTDYMSYGLQIRKKGVTDPYEQGSINYPAVIGSSYIDDDEKGALHIKKLAPGEYEIFSFFITEYNSSPQAHPVPNKDFPVPLKVTGFELMTKMVTAYSAQDFVIPITIKPGKAVYIGNFRAVTLATYRNMLGMTRSSGGAYFVLQDKRDRDIPAARRREPALNVIEYAIPEIKSIGTPYIRSNKVSNETNK